MRKLHLVKNFMIDRGFYGDGDLAVKKVCMLAWFTVHTGSEACQFTSIESSYHLLVFVIKTFLKSSLSDCAFSK